MSETSGDDLTILKLGGSVITDKDSPETVADEALDGVVSAIAESGVVDGDAPAELIIVHGGGSFGHVHAADHGVSTTDGTHDPAAVTAIHGAMKRLNGVVVDRLQAAGVPAVPVHPLSAAARDGDAALTLPPTAVGGLRTEGFVPVLHGDVIAHTGQGVTVLSGDELVTKLAETLAATRVGLCSTVPGVLDDEGEVIGSITAFEAVATAVGDSESTDVSGGMAGKVEALLALSQPARIFGPAAVGGFLADDAVGTLIDGA
jgi:isopentenyl phosphate kinase